MAADAAIQCEEGFASLAANANSKSLLKKHLTKELLDKLKTRKTKFGATLFDVIQSGVKLPETVIGVCAADPDSYNVFKELFDAILHDYSRGSFGPAAKQPPMDFGVSRLAEFVDLDPDQKFITSTRIRCQRALSGYPFGPLMSEAQYQEMDDKMRRVFEGFTDPDLQGSYYSLSAISQEDHDALFKNRILFLANDRFLQAANACRFWPTGRAVFHNREKTFVIWINQEDHLRIVSVQPNGNVAQVYERLIRGLAAIEKGIAFAPRDDRLGWLTMSPRNVGTTIRASVYVNLPKLSGHTDDFQKECNELNVKYRGIHGDGAFDIANKARLGLTEFESVKQMYDGVRKLVELEKKAA